MDSLSQSPKIINKCPVDLVSTSMNNLSLLKVPSVGSIWPEMNIAVRKSDIEVKQNNSIVGNVGYSSCISKSPKIQNCPTVVTNCSGNDSNNDSVNVNGEIDSDLEDLAKDLEEVAGIVDKYSGSHHMTLRPRQVSPRHCIVTLFDSEDDESTDSDYTVDLEGDDDEMDSSAEDLSSGDYSSDSEEDSDEDETETDYSDSSDEESDAPTTSCSKENKIIDKFESLIDRLASSSDEESYGSCSHSDESDSEIADKYLKKADDVFRMLPAAISAYNKVAEKESREEVAGCSRILGGASSTQYADGSGEETCTDSSDDSDEFPDDEQSTEDEDSVNGGDASESESTSDDDLSDGLDEEESSDDDDNSIDLEDSSESASESSDTSD